MLNVLYRSEELLLIVSTVHKETCHHISISRSHRHNSKKANPVPCCLGFYELVHMLV